MNSVTTAVTSTSGPVRNQTHKGVYGGNKYYYAIYPDYWKESWGRMPVLGYVWADSEFYAIRKAYSENLLTVNFTIQPKPVRINPPAKPKRN